MTRHGAGSTPIDNLRPVAYWSDSRRHVPDGFPAHPLYLSGAAHLATRGAAPL